MNWNLIPLLVLTAIVLARAGRGRRPLPVPLRLISRKENRPW